MSLLKNSYLLITIYSSSLMALDPGIIREISDINQQKLVGANYNCLKSLVTPFETRKNSNSPEYNDCAVALCGTPDKNPSAWVTDENFSNNIPEELIKKVNKMTPQIIRIVKKAKENNNLELKKLKETLAQDSMNLMNPKKFSQSFRDEIDLLVFRPYMEDVIDYSKPIDQRFSVKIKLPPNATADFTRAINEYALEYKNFVTNDAFNFNEKKLYNPKETFEIAQILLKKTQDYITSVGTKVSKQELELANKELEIAASVLKGSTPESFDAARFFPSVNYATSSFSLRQPEVKRFNSPPECNSNSCKNTYIEFVKSQNIEKNINALTSRLNDPEVERASINRCKATLVNSALKETNRKKAQSVFMEAKKAIMQNVLPRFSAHSRGILQEYLDKKLNYNSGNLMAKVSKNNTLEQFSNSAKSYLEDNEDQFFGDEFENSIKKGILFNSAMAAIDPLSDYQSPCSTGLTLSAWDAFLPVRSLRTLQQLPKEIADMENKDQIFVSDFSCTHDQRGKHAIAHEIGHALNYVFATQKLSNESAKLYNSIRNCAKDNYTEPQKDSTYLSQPGDSIYTEEDAADIFAFMSYPTDKDLFTCSLLKPSYTRGIYTDLDFISDEGDSHSTSFARVIIEASNKKITLPVSCQRIIKKDTPKMSLKKCI